MENPWLIGKQAFKDALKVQDKQLDAFVLMGMPVLIDNGRWYGHWDNINEWFKAKTRQQKRIGNGVDVE